MTEIMTTDKRLAIYMYFIDRDAMREGIKILGDLGYHHYTEHPEHGDKTGCDADLIFIEAWKPAPADVNADDEDEGEDGADDRAAIFEINAAIGMLGDAIESGIYDADEMADWWDTRQ